MASAPRRKSTIALVGEEGLDGLAEALDGDVDGVAVAEGVVLAAAPDVEEELFGGDDGQGLFTGPGAASMSGVWRGRIAAVEQLGADLRVDLLPPRGDE